MDSKRRQWPKFDLAKPSLTLYLLSCDF
uniref:Uncharacterized protein n=1 Tax=Rhizophora mucronata TaxID=61149 RepID=A0A2P2NDB7_RHIMU